jgi:diacylglycerol O-acyltransferase / wax synthase
VAEQLEHLSASDVSSLLAERGPIHVHVGGTILLEGEPPDFEELLAHVERRLDLVPRFRQRVTAIPLGIDNPVWEEAPSFDLRWHVRHAALPRPGTAAQLRELVGWVMSEPLDLGRPLWQIYLVEGLEGGRHAVISKTHHALVDGVSALDVGTLLLDVSPEGTEIPVPGEDEEEPREPTQLSPALLMARAASGRGRRTLRAARRAARTALTMPRETASRVVRTAEGFGGMAARGARAPETFLNEIIGRDRRVVFARTPLADLKAAKAESGATVNDVVLAIAAGALRRLFERRDKPLPEHLVALVPVSVRRPDEPVELGNRIATILVRLPLREADPAARLRLINEETTRLKRSEQARVASLMIEASGWAPPTINRLLAGSLSRPFAWNLVISNVPGPQFPLYLLGRRMLELYPFVPLSPQGRTLSIGVLSYDGGVFFGVVGDRDRLHDIDLFAADLEGAIAEQTGARSAPRS